MRALIVIDMLEDFVHGPLANPKAATIVAPLGRLLAFARTHGWVVVFANDAHRRNDPELRVWGQHAMRGTPGAEVIAELAPRVDELIVPKRTYGAFDLTGLDRLLWKRHVDEVVLAGQHTHLCVLHTAYGAFIRGIDVTVPRDAVCAFPDVDEDEALAYLAMAYGARITTVAELTLPERAEAA